MHISKSTFIVFVIVLIVMTLSVTVFKGESPSLGAQQNARVGRPTYQDHRDRFPVVEAEEVEPADPVKQAKLKRQKRKFDKDAPFVNPGPKDEELAFRPEAQFDFPALPVVKSDAVVIGQVLDAKAHRSENGMNVFSNFELRVDEVLKGNLTRGSVITVERIGGFVRYPNGRKVLFRLSGNGMPGVGARYAFFLNVSDEDYSILTAYELGADGVAPLDNSSQFRVYKGETEANFMKALRDAISKAGPR